MTKEQFEEVTKWQNETFPAATFFSQLSHLDDEIIELAIEFSSVERKNLSLEFADCFMLLFGAAAKAGMSYEEIYKAINKKMEINKKRKWGKPDERGVYTHVK